MKSVLLFIALLISQVCYAQDNTKIIEFEKASFDKALIIPKIKHFEIWKLKPAKNFETSVHSLALRFEDSTLTFENVENSNVEKDDFVVTVGDKQYDKDPNLHHFNSVKGEIKTCRISVANHFILGQFTVRKEKYIIEQLKNLIAGVDENLIIVYKSNDVVPMDVTCGTESSVNKEKKGSLINNNSNITNGICRTIDYGIAVDYTSFLNHGSDIDQTTNYILSIMNLVEGNYVGVFTDDLFFKISEIVIFTSPQVNPWVSTSNINSNLNSFTGWATTGFSKPFDDASYWFSNNKFRGGTIGLAWVNTTCLTNGNNTNTIMEYGTSADNMRCLVAHEIGHNFGCEHTDGFIMNPVIGPYTTWAPESIFAVNNRISGPDGACITPCEFTACERNLTSNVKLTDDGEKYKIKWLTSEYPVRIDKRNSSTGSFTKVGVYYAPVDSVFIPYMDNLNFNYGQFRITTICPDSKDGVSTIVTIEPSAKRPKLNIKDSILFCLADSLLLSVNESLPSYKYQWKINNVDISNANSPTLEAYLPGYYQCQLTLPNNYIFNTDSLKLIPVKPFANYSFNKIGLNVNFSNESDCSSIFRWEMGNGKTSVAPEPSQLYSSPGIYKVCLNSSNSIGSSQKCLSIPVFQSWEDGMNNTTDGIASSITYQKSQCDTASVFKMKSLINPALNSFITYPQNDWIPLEGSLEFSVKIYNGSESGNMSTSALIFNAGNTDFNNRSYILANSSGDILFRRYNGATYTDILAAATNFRFNEWHIISVSYGSLGTQIAVDGKIFANNTSVNFRLNQGITTLGQASGFPSSDYFQGFEGLVDKFRISYSQSDFQLTEKLQPPNSTITASSNNICAGTRITFNAATNAPNAHYQWKKDGISVGSDTSYYNDSSFSNGTMVTCLVAATEGCFSATPIISNIIPVSVTEPALPIVAIVASSNSICSGNPIAFTAKSNAPSSSYQWKKNNLNVGENSATYTDNHLKNNDVIICSIIAQSGCFLSGEVTSNPIKVIITIPQTPAVIITASSTHPCAGGSVTFTTSPTNGGSSPIFNWFKNGIPIATGATYYASGLADGDQVFSTLTSSLGCVTSATANSNIQKINVRPIVTSKGSITTTNNNICAGTTVVFSATSNIENAIFQWSVGGIIVGNNSKTFSISSLKNGDIVSCTITAPAADCYTSYSINTNTIQMIVKPKVNPAISIMSSEAGNFICEGQSVKFTAKNNNEGTNPTYQWKKNGSGVGSNSAELQINTLVNGDEISCLLTSNEACLVTNNIASNSIKTEVATLNPVITQKGFNLTLNESTPGATWQWFLNEQPISGATTVTYQATTFGNYTASEKYKSCIKISKSLSINPLNNTNGLIKIFPNPTSNILFAQTQNSNIIIKSVKVYDGAGKLIIGKIFTGNNLIEVNVANLSSAFYIAEFETSMGVERIKFVKK